MKKQFKNYRDKIRNKIFRHYSDVDICIYLYKKLDRKIQAAIVKEKMYIQTKHNN